MNGFIPFSPNNFDKLVGLQVERRSDLIESVIQSDLTYANNSDTSYETSLTFTDSSKGSSSSTNI